MKQVQAICVFIIFLCFIIAAKSKNVLSRQKRYLVFPEGSSLSIAICMTAQTGITPGEIFTEGINWGISYDLPNDTKPFKDVFDKPEKLMQQRHRRELYSKMETILNSMGYNGRECIQRVLCEASQNLKPQGESLLDEILRIVFGYPSTKNEDEWINAAAAHYHYSKAAQEGINKNDDNSGLRSRQCFEFYSQCPFSLIDMAQGYYSFLGNLSPFTYN